MLRFPGEYLSTCCWQHDKRPVLSLAHLAADLLGLLVGNQIGQAAACSAFQGLSQGRVNIASVKLIRVLPA